MNWVYYQHFENHGILSISHNIQYQVSFISECNRISPVCASKHKIASAGNRTRGSCMASRNFTTKPLMLTWLVQDLKIDSHTYIHTHISSLSADYATRAYLLDNVSSYISRAVLINIVSLFDSLLIYRKYDSIGLRYGVYHWITALRSSIISSYHHICGSTTLLREGHASHTW